MSWKNKKLRRSTAQYTPQEMKAGLSLFIHSSNKYLLHNFCMLSPATPVYSGNKTGMVPAHGVCQLVMLRSTIFLCSRLAVGDKQGQGSRNNPLFPPRLFLGASPWRVG